MRSVWIRTYIDVSYLILLLRESPCQQQCSEKGIRRGGVTLKHVALTTDNCALKQLL